FYHCVPATDLQTLRIRRSSSRSAPTFGCRILTQCLLTPSSIASNGYPTIGTSNDYVRPFWQAPATLASTHWVEQATRAVTLSFEVTRQVEKLPLLIRFDQTGASSSRPTASESTKRGTILMSWSSFVQKPYWHRKRTLHKGLS